MAEGCGPRGSRPGSDVACVPASPGGAPAARVPVPKGPRGGAAIRPREEGEGSARSRRYGCWARVCVRGVLLDSECAFYLMTLITCHLCFPLQVLQLAG
jgi:hypothetical protein